MQDKYQEAAIIHGEGPALVVAGPGSGKTFVLTHHILHLLETGVPPEKILVITFTRQAALEMKSRFRKLNSDKNSKIVFGTFHSVFYKILSVFIEDIPQIISSDLRREILLISCPDSTLTEEYSLKISFYKSLINKEKFVFESKSEKENFEKVLKSYNDELKRRRLWDFDDILKKFYEMLRDDKKALETISKQFSHILIDEFQDINEIQYEAVRLIFRKNIFTVGDEDQSIYAFRGATGKIFKNFIEDYKDAVVYELVNNYRSKEGIIRAAETVIKDNPGRFKTNAQICVNKSDGRDFYLCMARDETEIRDLIRLDVNRLNEPKKSMAILVRTNRDVFEYRKIFSGGKAYLSVKSEIYKAFLAYFKYSVSRDRGSLIEILNIPDRKIPESILNMYGFDLTSLRKRFLGTYLGERLDSILQTVRAVSSLPAVSSTMYLRNACGLEKYFIEKYGEGNATEVIDTFDEIFKLSLSMDKEMLIKNLSETVNKNPSEELQDSNLTITTYHQSKGLEFDYVFLPDIIEGKMPGVISLNACTIEEERRLLFVAMTRAREKLVLYTIKSEGNSGAAPSRFIEGLIY